MKPHVADAWIDWTKTKTGDEIPFTRHFYKYDPPRPLEEIDADLEKSSARSWTCCARWKHERPRRSALPAPWLPDLPAHWSAVQLRPNLQFDIFPAVTFVTALQTPQVAILRAEGRCRATRHRRRMKSLVRTTGKEADERSPIVRSASRSGSSQSRRTRCRSPR